MLALRFCEPVFPIDPRSTSPRAFFLLDGKSVMTPMMMTPYPWKTYPYRETNSFQAVRLPYTNPRFVMYVFLPREKDGLREFLGSLDHQHWKDWTAGFKPTRGHNVLAQVSASLR